MKQIITVSKQYYKRYIKIIKDYNNTLPIGITRCFTYNKMWYKCNYCTFSSKHKHDTMRHYNRIHVKKNDFRYR